MTDKEYAADCIEFLRRLAHIIRLGDRGCTIEDDADKLEEIAAVLQVDTQEETRDDIKCACVSNYGPNPECGACGGSGCVEGKAK